MPVDTPYARIKTFCVAAKFLNLIEPDMEDPTCSVIEHLIVVAFAIPEPPIEIALPEVDQI